MNKFTTLILAVICSMFLLIQKAKADELVLRTDSGLIAVEELLKKGNYTAALDATTSVIMRHQRDADAYTYRGYAYYKLGEKQKAFESFKTAIMIDPAHLGANKYLANIYIDEGHIDRALEQLQAMRMVCGSYNCAEIDILQSEIDKAKSTVEKEE